MSVKSLYPAIYKKSSGGDTINVIGTGDDRISLMKPEKGEWSEIILTEYVETGYKVRYANFFPEEGKNLSTAYLLVMNSVEYVIENGIAETAFWTFSIIPNKIFDNGDLTAYAGAYATTFTPKTTESGEYYDITLYTYKDFMFYYGEEKEASAWGAIVYSQPPQEVNTQYGYYINRTDVKFGTGETGILLSDLDNITYRLNGLAFNGREAWNYTGESATNRYAALVDENDNPIADLVIWDGKNWNNDVYSASELGEGWIDATDGSVIILFTGGTNGGDLNKLFDFYFEQRKTTNDITRYELHTPRVVNYNDGLNTYAVTQYSNKGYLLGLPTSDEVDTLNSDTHIVGTIEIYNPTGSTTRVKAEFAYPSGKPYMQAIIQRTYGYLYVRLYDNFVTSPHEVENAVDYVEFTAAAGKSTIVAFLHETDNYADDVVYLEDLEDFISYKNKIAVIINIPSQKNVIASQLGEKTITENGTYNAVDDDVKGYSAVTVNVPSSEPTLVEKTITENGEYLASAESPAADGFSQVTVNVAGGSDDYGYKRVSGVPDGAALLAAATNITVGEVEYMPIYILINYANTISDTYTKTGTGVATGADAYLFSDAPTTLEVGASVTHTWDLSKDIETVKVWGCRWVICYAVKSGYTYTTISLHSYNNRFELIGGANLIVQGEITGTNSSNSSFKYINLALSTFYLNALSYNYTINNAWALIEIVLPDSLTICKKTHFMNGCMRLRKVVANGLETVTGERFLLSNGLNSISLPNLTTIDWSYFIGSSYSVDYFDMSKVTSILANTGSVALPYAIYIKLADGFNVSGTNFSGSVTKSIQWFYDLAEWLYDRSGGTAGSLILGANNIAILNSLYLEDGTTPLTSIFDAKNWTRS